MQLILTTIQQSFLEDWSMLKVQAIQQTLHQQKED
jgi:hypothetical protein